MKKEIRKGLMIKYQKSGIFSGLSGNSKSIKLEVY